MNKQQTYGILLGLGLSVGAICSYSNNIRPIANDTYTDSTINNTFIKTTTVDNYIITCVEKPKSISLEKPKSISLEKPKSISLEKPKSISLEKPKLNVTTDVPISWIKHLNKLSNESGYELELLMAIIEKESNWNPKKVSKTKDYGLAQINRVNLNTVKQVALKKYGYFNIFDPYINMDSMVVMLDENTNIFKKVKKRPPTKSELLVSYNIGITKTLKTSRGQSAYSKDVIKYYYEYKKLTKYLREANLID